MVLEEQLSSTQGLEPTESNIAQEKRMIERVK